MKDVKFWARVIWFVLLVAVAACSKTPPPTAPTPPPPPPPPPVANPPSIACGEGISRSTVNAGGLVITYETPPVSDGQGSVSVTCSPESGHTFPIGTTQVSCTATDTLNRSATCSFTISVTKLPTLSRTRFLAFGDSITAGEVTFPVGSLFTATSSFTKQVVIPTLAYPAVLERTLRGRYPSQASTIVVANYGLSGEKAINARNRFFDALTVVRPEAVLLMEGYNDIPGGLDGAASGAANEIRIMAAEAKRRGALVYLATLAPGRPNGGRTIGQIFIDDYNNRMRVVAAQEGAVLVDIYNSLRTDINRYIGVDGLHPNEVGYAKIADTFFQAIQNTLEVR
ncbi:MAG TPA: GDSL-type esterase/lipase family protein [Vicinamibacterales bacterium]|nr:GDSL-type esterase/lipase family protein [Vicinamibacterales bacterium]